MGRGEGQNRSVEGDGRFQRGNLEHAAGLAFLAGLAGLLAVLGHLAHVVAAIFIHVGHVAHAAGLHGAGLGWRFDARHPGQGKRQADQEDEENAKAPFHAAEFSSRLVGVAIVHA